MDISNLRTELDKIDAQLSRLFVKRMDIAEEVGRYKAERNLPVFDAAREREILNKTADMAGEKYEDYAKTLFGTLLSMSRGLQSRIIQPDSLLGDMIKKAENKNAGFPSRATVACQGVEGAYSQQACDKIFSLADVLYVNSFEGVFRAVEAGMCQYGILPVENSLAGSVNAVYDLMRKHKFFIVRGARLKIDHSLLANAGAAFSDIREIISHDQAIGQCGAFLDAHPDIKVTRFENTAAAARYVKESGRGDLAAISSRGCAEIYGLKIIRDDIQDNSSNFTRFICISKSLEIYSGANKISLMLSVPHRPGSLFALMSKMSALGLNLTKIESRPIAGRDFEFMFYFDLDAQVTSPKVTAFLGELERETDLFQFLGGYQEIV